MGFVYPPLSAIIEAHENALTFGGGGLPGVRDAGQLDSLLDHLQNDAYYPTFERKITRLFFGLTKFHCFNDGNKRTAIAASSLMLIANAFAPIVPRFIRDMENISVLVADNVVSEGLLYEIICTHIAIDPDNEEIKLKLFEAMSARQP